MPSKQLLFAVTGHLALLFYLLLQRVELERIGQIMLRSLLPLGVAAALAWHYEVPGLLHAALLLSPLVATFTALGLANEKMLPSYTAGEVLVLNVGLLFVTGDNPAARWLVGSLAVPLDTPWPGPWTRGQFLANLALALWPSALALLVLLRGARANPGPRLVLACWMHLGYLVLLAPSAWQSVALFDRHTLLSYCASTFDCVVLVRLGLLLVLLLGLISAQAPRARARGELDVAAQLALRFRAGDWPAPAVLLLVAALAAALYQVGRVPVLGEYRVDAAMGLVFTAGYLVSRPLRRRPPAQAGQPTALNLDNALPQEAFAGNDVLARGIMQVAVLAAFAGLFLAMRRRPLDAEMLSLDELGVVSGTVALCLLLAALHGLMRRMAEPGLALLSSAGLAAPLVAWKLGFAGMPVDGPEAPPRQAAAFQSFNIQASPYQDRPATLLAAPLQFGAHGVVAMGLAPSGGLALDFTFAGQFAPPARLCASGWGETLVRYSLVELGSAGLIECRWQDGKTWLVAADTGGAVVATDHATWSRPRLRTVAADDGARSAGCQLGGAPAALRCRGEAGAVTQVPLDVADAAYQLWPVPAAFVAGGVTRYELKVGDTSVACFETQASGRLGGASVAQSYPAVVLALVDDIDPGQVVVRAMFEPGASCARVEGLWNGVALYRLGPEMAAWTGHAYWVMRLGVEAR